MEVPVSFPTIRRIADDVVMGKLLILVDYDGDLVVECGYGDDIIAIKLNRPGRRAICFCHPISGTPHIIKKLPGSFHGNLDRR